MSSLSGSAVEGNGVPEGSGKKAEALEMMPPVSRKRGRPKGSRNKKTLAALAAAADAAATTTTATGAALSPAGEGVPEKRGPGRLRGSGRKAAPTATAAPSPYHRRGWPPGSKNKKTLVALGAPASNSPRPHAATSPPVVRRGSGRRNRHSSRGPTSQPRGGPPA
jgi:hypothetical protein